MRRRRSDFLLRLRPPPRWLPPVFLLADVSAGSRHPPPWEIFQLGLFCLSIGLRCPPPAREPLCLRDGGVDSAPPLQSVDGPSGASYLDEVWVALESRGSHKVGDVVDVSRGGSFFTRLGDRGAWRSTGSSVPLGVGLVGSLAAGPSQAGGAPDSRVLPWVRRAGQPRGRAFGAAVEELTVSPEAAWEIKGPKTVSWVCQAVAHQGTTPVQRHFWWRSLLRLTAADSGVDEHKFLCDLLETGLCGDQLNLGELEVFELISRRLQLWEEVHSQKLRKADAGAGSEAWLDERAIFLGQGRSRGQALIAPALEAWVASKLAEESAVLKERRKGREERQLLAGLGSTAIGGGGADSASGGGGGSEQTGGGNKKGQKGNKGGAQ